MLESQLEQWHTYTQGCATQDYSKGQGIPLYAHVQWSHVHRANREHVDVTDAHTNTLQCTQSWREAM